MVNVALVWKNLSARKASSFDCSLRCHSRSCRNSRPFSTEAICEMANGSAGVVRPSSLKSFFSSLYSQSLITTTSSSLYAAWLILLLAANCFGAGSAEANFSIARTSYECGSNVICMGGAHRYTDNANDKLQVGMLSLIQESFNYATQTSGIAYYKEAVRLVDPSSNQSASFNTSFVIEVVNSSVRTDNGPADGMAFVINADNSRLGQYGRTLGIFNSDGLTDFKAIVVELDEYQNAYYPTYDINDNHVSFDFGNITTNISGNAYDVNVVLGDGQTTYVWVEYSGVTMILEARISNRNVRPKRALLNYTVDLSDVAEEYMWIGFSSGASFIYSNYYIGDWTFESYGIPPSSPSAGSRKSVVGLGVGLSVGFLALLLACIAIVVVVRRRRGGRGWFNLFADDSVVQLEGMPERYTYKQLSVATRGFNKESKLGRGGFGSVYRGLLPSSGIPVAVKKIDGDSTQGEKEFMAEVSIISQLRHRNLIQLLGWCKDASRGDYLLVYELMPNASLDKVLFGPFEKDTPCLSWPQRLNIVTGTAAALDYLHQGWKQQVIHRDIKSSNIMLDENWNAKLGDFGLARLVDHEMEAATTVVAGTYGYIAPEVAASGRFTEKTDVFAFGAVVLEVVCGRRALLIQTHPEEVLLVDWVWRRLSEGNLLSTVDKRLEEYDAHWMKVLLMMGLCCSHPNPLARPTMRHVVQILAGDAPLPSIPTTKPHLVYSSDLQTDDLSIDEFFHKNHVSSESPFRAMSVSLRTAPFSDSTGGSTTKSSGKSSSSYLS